MEHQQASPASRHARALYGIEEQSHKKPTKPGSSNFLGPDCCLDASGKRRHVQLHPGMPYPPKDYPFRYIHFVAYEDMFIPKEYRTLRRIIYVRLFRATAADRQDYGGCIGSERPNGCGGPRPDNECYSPTVDEGRYARESVVVLPVLFDNEGGADVNMTHVKDTRFDKLADAFVVPSSFITLVMHSGQLFTPTDTIQLMRDRNLLNIQRRRAALEKELGSNEVIEVFSSDEEDDNSRELPTSKRQKVAHESEVKQESTLDKGKGKATPEFPATPTFSTPPPPMATGDIESNTFTSSPQAVNGRLPAMPLSRQRSMSSVYDPTPYESDLELPDVGATFETDEEGVYDADDTDDQDYRPGRK